MTTNRLVPPGPLRDHRVHWLAADVLAWPRDLLPDDGAGLALELWLGGGAEPGSGARVVELARLPGGLPHGVGDRFPHLREHLVLHPVGVGRADAAEALRGAVVAVARRGGGTAGVVVRTGVQIGGVLDDLYPAAVTRSLGATWADGVPSLAVWAPTALDVALLLFVGGPGAEPERVTMRRADDGAWTCAGTADWTGLAYRYEVTVHVPAAGALVVSQVTDPYSVALTADSTHSVLVDLADPRFRPSIWEDAPVPRVPRAVDRTIYELHVRDFSAADPTVPPEHRGTYLAFAGEGSGVAHLRSLARAGLNTVHLLPVFDFAGVPERLPDRRGPAGDLAAFPPDAPDQQAAVAAVADRDAYNWGYNPWHHLAPEGSYASEGHADGGARVSEFRTMVGAMHRMGLSVVLDQVHNHTAAHGQDHRSVLDRIVPGYYHRLDAGGAVVSSTCCSNVATERLMAGKILVDTVVHWARHYRVGGFRFDLMGHHTRENLVAARAALDALTVESDGVDGRGVYLYGEGWNFGEVADDRLFVQARQGNLGGTGVGTFSDRLRDAVLGGTAVDHGSLRAQGFATGLATDPNGHDPRSRFEQESEAAHLADLVRLGMTGNLRAFAFLTAQGLVQRGEEIDYRGVPAGYADSPEEVVTYVDAHDNHTLFDHLALRLPPATPMALRVRVAMLALATVALSQTPMMWHAGTDLLRSKSLDVDSYDSGDWFNAVDWSGRESAFGRGLPPAARNRHLWDVYRPLLGRADLRPGPEHIALTRAWALDLLRLRFSTPLLRLGATEQILAKVTVPRSGPGARPGLVLLHVDDRVGPDVDPALDGVLVVVNARPEDVGETVPALAGRTYRLSPVQEAGADPVVRATAWDTASGTVHVPGRTAAVLVEPA